MCLTEIWRYRDCGCTYEYLVPYGDFLDDEEEDCKKDDCLTCFRSQTYPSHTAEDHDGYRDGFASAPTIPTPTNSVTNSVAKPPIGHGTHPTSQLRPEGTCGTHHIVHRLFLEPVCDDCGFVEQLQAFDLDSATEDKNEVQGQNGEEKGIHKDDENDPGNDKEHHEIGIERLNSGYSQANGAGIGDGQLILESNVKIEIVPERYSEDSIDITVETSRRQPLSAEFDKSGYRTRRDTEDLRGRARDRGGSGGSGCTLTTPSTTSTLSVSASSISGSGRARPFAPKIEHVDEADSDADADDELSLCNPTPKPAEMTAAFASPVTRHDDDSNINSSLSFNFNNIPSPNLNNENKNKNSDDDLSPLSPNVTIMKRCHLRTRSKELRRRGMDISREQLRLRIASAWSSGEKESMCAFKDYLKGERPARLFGEGKDVEEVVAESRKWKELNETRGRVGVRGWANGLAGRVGRSLGRRERRGKHSAEGDEIEEKKRGHHLQAGTGSVLDGDGPNLTSEGKREGTNPNFKSGPNSSNSTSSINTIFEIDGDSTYQNQSQTPSPTNNTNTEESDISEAAFTTTQSWEQHLREDLGASVRGATKTHQGRELQEPRCCKADLHFDSDDIDEVQMRRRLLSESSAMPSISSGALSGISESAWCWRSVQPLSLSSGDFETSGNQWIVRNQESYGDDTQRQGEEDVTSIEDRMSVRTRSLEGARHARVWSTESTFSAAQEQVITPTLAIHPLTTPICRSTPIRSNEHPERSSSLFSLPTDSASRARPGVEGLQLSTG